MEWWKKAVIYQIYPRSYKDSTNNGIGDIRGIIEKFDYIKELGINTIWFSPFFTSPQADFGYDVADYCNIDPVYGTMEDFNELLSLAHKNGIKILLDLVMNHSSSEHNWFKESRKNKDNPYRDYYIWRDGRKPAGKAPPNNWKSYFGGSAWTYDEETDQWFYHHFLKEQPDLNYRNLKVKEEMFNSVRFWLDKGIDGFRLDVIHTIYELEELTDNPWDFRILPKSDSPLFFFQNHKYDQDLPETLEFVKELRKVVNQYSDRVLIGEVIQSKHCSTENFRNFLGENLDGLHLIFNFPIMETSFKAESFYNSISDVEIAVPDPYWPCLPLSNHDRQRMISRYGNNEEKAKLMALMQLTLRGTPVIYYGEEIGMHQRKFKRKEVVDPVGKHFWWSPIQVGRDGCRTPMQWSDVKYGGFSNGEKSTWLPLNKNYHKVNVKSQEGQKDSMLSFYKNLLKFRRENRIFQEGEILVIPILKDLLIYQRMLNEERYLVILNFSKKGKKLSLRELFLEALPYKKVEMIFSTKDSELPVTISEKNPLVLDKYEGIVLKMK